MDDTELDPWSAIAAEWQQRWGRLAAPAWDVVLDECGAEAGQRALDVGCGSGELIAHLARRGLTSAGVDPSPAMVALATSLVPAADIRIAAAEALPFDEGVFDVTIAVNALHLVDDPAQALAEMRRVTVDGGRVAVVTWTQRSLNDLDAVDAAIARADGDEPSPDDGLRLAGELERLLGEAGVLDLQVGVVTVPFDLPDDDALVRAVLLGEDPATVESYAPVVLAAARPFRGGDGTYRLKNHLRYAVGCTSRRSR